MSADGATRLAWASGAGSVLFAGALFAAHFASGSELALAQAADSASDALSALVLGIASRAAGRIADAEHPHGHHGAEPIGALVVAVLIGVLAIEVGRDAVEALVGGAPHPIGGAVAVAVGLKVAFKAGIVVFARRAERSVASPTLDALRIDARNDVLVGSLALVASIVVRAGIAPAVATSIDAALAIGVAAYVAASALRLARDNVTLLMGASVPPARVEALTRVASGVDGVVRVDRLIAVWHGTAVHVTVDVAVDGALSVARGHAIADAVEVRLAAEPDVDRAVVHVGPARERSETEASEEALPVRRGPRSTAREAQ